MPKEIPKDLTSIGGNATELGRDNFLRKAQELRARIMANKPKLVDITESVFSSEYRGTLSKPAANSAAKNKRGNKVPKSITKLNNVTDVAGKRGRKSEFNPNDWVMDIGIENAFDVTDEMLSGIEKLDEPFEPELLFSNDNKDVNKYRSNRFGGMKRAAISANGEGSKYELKTGENEDGDKVWVLVRTA